MEKTSLHEKAERSKCELMGRFDLSGLQFYLFLPTFNPLYRKKLCKRITDYQGQVTLTPKAGNQYVIVSDNVIGYVVERDNIQQLKAHFSMSPEPKTSFKENRSLNMKQSKRTKQMLMSGTSDISDKTIYQNFIQEQKDKQKNEKTEILEQFDEIIAMDMPVVKITDFHHVLDYFDSFTKFEWHTKRDDARMLRSLINEEG